MDVPKLLGSRAVRRLALGLACLLSALAIFHTYPEYPPFFSGPFVVPFFWFSTNPIGFFLAIVAGCLVAWSGPLRAELKLAAGNLAILAAYGAFFALRLAYQHGFDVWVGATIATGITVCGVTLLLAVGARFLTDRTRDALRDLPDRDLPVKVHGRERP